MSRFELRDNFDPTRVSTLGTIQISRDVWIIRSSSWQRRVCVESSFGELEYWKDDKTDACWPKLNSEQKAESLGKFLIAISIVHPRKLCDRRSKSQGQQLFAPHILDTE
jgi:hypothetical protein